MIPQATKILGYLDKLPIWQVRTAWIARVRAEHERLDTIEAGLIRSGMERVECDGPITADGREVMRIKNRAYALRPEVHAERLAQRFSAKKDDATKSIAGTEVLSEMVCKKCGDVMQHSSVCPSCSIGKLGYKHRYSCSCGADIVSKDKI